MQWKTNFGLCRLLWEYVQYMNGIVTTTTMRFTLFSFFHITKCLLLFFSFTIVFLVSFQSSDNEQRQTRISIQHILSIYLFPSFSLLLLLLLFTFWFLYGFGFSCYSFLFCTFFICVRFAVVYDSFARGCIKWMCACVCVCLYVYAWMLSFRLSVLPCDKRWCTLFLFSFELLSCIRHPRTYIFVSSFRLLSYTFFVCCLVFSFDHRKRFAWCKQMDCAPNIYDLSWFLCTNTRIQ